MLTQKEIALEYANNGFPVFPCHVKTKSPLVKNGFYSATCDSFVIEKWWDDHPNALIASPSDNSFIVADFDFDKGISVIGWYQHLKDAYGLSEGYEVSTPSGGKHIYFSYDEYVPRRIGVIQKGFDILGKGGYAILPDNRNYFASDSSFLFETNLTDVPPILRNLSTCRGSEIKQAFRQTGITHKLTDLYLDTIHIQNEQSATVVSTSSRKQTFDDDLEFKRNKIKEQKEKDKNIYIKSTYVDKPTIFTRSEDGKIHIQPDSIDTALINQLFYNKENQIRMASYLGIPVPTEKRRRKFNSIIYGHEDKSPSMGSRWSEKGDHIIVRDFSNFFGDPDERIDYNLTRLYVQNKYSEVEKKSISIKHINSPEFCVWTLRLLKESGVIEFSIPTFDERMDKSELTEKEHTIIESFCLLHGVKACYRGYEGGTVFAKKFAAAWSGVAKTTLIRSFKKLRDLGFMKLTGTYGEGKYAANVYAMGEYKEVKEVNTSSESTQLNQVRSFKKMPQDEMPLGVLFGAEIDSSYKEMIKNFCQDFDIENVTDNKYMALVIATSDENYQIDQVLQGPLIVSDFMLVTVENEGKTSLLVSYASSVAEKLFFDISSKYDVTEEVPDFTFVISYDYDGPDDEDTLNELSYQFNQYFPMIEASKEITGYYMIDEIEAYIFGESVEA